MIYYIVNKILGESWRNYTVIVSSPNHAQLGELWRRLQGYVLRAVQKLEDVDASLRLRYYSGREKACL